MEALKPVKNVKDNCRNGDASSISSGYCRHRIDAVNGLFTDDAWYENWSCKPPVPSSPSHFSVLVKFVSTGAKLPPNTGYNIL